MDDPQFWRGLAERFEAFQSWVLLSADRVRSIKTDGNEKIWWEFSPPGGSITHQWKGLAMQSGEVLNPAIDDPIGVWLEELLKRGQWPEKDVPGPGGSREIRRTINSIHVVSGYHCRDLEFKAVEARSKARRTVHNEATDTSVRPLVFISCGQFTDDEIRLGKQVAAAVERLTACEGYFAETQNSLLGLSQHIFGALNRAVGLIAIMHHRGQVETPLGLGKHIRGSVWVEQEIAIAAFLAETQRRQLPVIVYLQKGIAREGVRQQLRLSPVEFETSDEVVKDLAFKIATEAFKPSGVVIESRSGSPPRNPVEEQLVEITRAALDELGPDATVVLRHLYDHGSITFSDTGYPMPVLPATINARDTRAILEACITKSLVTRTSVSKIAGSTAYAETTYQIAPGRKDVMPRLLYAPTE